MKRQSKPIQKVGDSLQPSGMADIEDLVNHNVPTIEEADLNIVFKQQIEAAKKYEEELMAEQIKSNILSELNSVLPIREYMINTINNSSIDRAAVNYLSGSLILLDRKILGLLQSDAFKQYINYADVKQAVQDVVNLNNIKSGFRK